MYKVNDKIRIKNLSPLWNGAYAKIVNIDGAYVMVAPYGYSHEIELNENEVDTKIA